MSSPGAYPARERSDRQPVAISGREMNFEGRYGRSPGSVSYQPAWAPGGERESCGDRASPWRQRASAPRAARRRGGRHADPMIETIGALHCAIAGRAGRPQSLPTWTAGGGRGRPTARRQRADHALGMVRRFGRVWPIEGAQLAWCPQRGCGARSAWSLAVEPAWRRVGIGSGREGAQCLWRPLPPSCSFRGAHGGAVDLRVFKPDYGRVLRAFPCIGCHGPGAELSRRGESCGVAGWWMLGFGGQCPVVATLRARRGRLQRPRPRA